MKRLTLIRHANADWKDMSVADFDRPLNRRGAGEAEAMGKLLLEEALLPDLILASSARRTQQTTEILARKLALEPRRLKSMEALYLATPEDILALVRATGPLVEHLAIVGHNPGISELSKHLAPEDAAVADLTTGAACTLTFSVQSWQELTAPASGAVRFEPPSKLLHLFG